MARKKTAPADAPAKAPAKAAAKSLGSGAGKTLIIAEKPSVAGDLARALGKFKKEKDWYENEEYIISSAIGHLVEIQYPLAEGEKKPGWNFKVLPLLPESFALVPIKRTEDRFRVLKKLVNSKNVARIINACDAGREGELIFRYLIQATGCTKPTQRLWLQSMTPEAIREGIQQLRSSEEMQPLADAAVCRSESDWLVGINATRALTAFNSTKGGFQLTTAGRVQTPTLAILVDREERIKNFQPRPYWELLGTFAAGPVAYVGKWFDENFKKPEKAQEGSPEADLRADRLWQLDRAEAIAALCQGKPAEVTEEKKPSSQAAPLLFDLTTLQREANGRFGFSARTTLQIAQSLYEKHKAITYPRTDSRHLPEDYLATVTKTLKAMEEPFAALAAPILKNGWVKPNRRIFDNGKVSDHFAIIPTPQQPGKLTDVEEKLYQFIVRRFLAIFYPSAVYEVTTRLSRVEGHVFKTEGKILKEAGWLAVYGKDASEQDEDKLLQPLPADTGVTTEKVEVVAQETKPPPRLTEATLLSAMEGAGKLVEDEELREAMAEKGLGTPATRAAIIEGLLQEGYIAREGKTLVPLAKAFALMDTLHTIDVSTICSPEMTGEWEHKLKQIERKRFTRPQFMREIRGLVVDMVDKIKKFDPHSLPDKPTDLVDPFSGARMFETLHDYRSPDGSLAIRKVIGGRVMGMDDIRELLDKRLLGPLTGFRSRLGRPFAASLRLTDEKKVEFVFENANANDARAPHNQFLGDPIGTCPLDGGKVYETPTSYVCENGVGAEAKCTLRIGKIILSQAIGRADVEKILQEGKSGLLTQFKSNRTGRFFKAFLVLDKATGKVGFEFPPREPRKPGAKGGRKAKVAEPAEA